jgi:hypothetical protein
MKPYLGEQYTFGAVPTKASTLYHDQGYDRPITAYYITPNGFGQGRGGIFFGRGVDKQRILGQWAYAWCCEAKQTREEIEEIAQQVMDLLRAAGEAE